VKPGQSSNPLTGTVIVVLLSEAWTVKHWWMDHNQPDVFAAFAVVHAAVLTILYLRKSPFAGTFLVISIAPIYPLYYVACQNGWYGRPLQTPLALAMLIVWIVGMFFVWREKQKYERYLAPIIAAERDPASARDDPPRPSSR
jgi:hypothetical protein